MTTKKIGRGEYEYKGFSISACHYDSGKTLWFVNWLENKNDDPDVYETKKSAIVGINNGWGDWMKDSKA